MKNVASLFSGSLGPRSRAIFSVMVAICLLLPLVFVAGCGDDEETGVNYPTVTTEEAKHWMFGVGGTDASNVYACGRNGAMFHFDGTSWSTVDMGVTTDIVDVQNIDGTLYAVGHNGKIWENTGSSWNSMTSGTSENLYGIGKYQDEIYACGYDATLLKRSGSSWNAMGGTIVQRDPSSGAPIDTLFMDIDIFSLVTVGDNYIGGSYLDPTWDGPLFGTDGTKGMILTDDVPLDDEELIFDFWMRPLSGAELIDAEWLVSGTSDSETLLRNFVGTSEGYLFQLQNDGNWAKDNLQITKDRGYGISDMYLTPDNQLYMVTDDGLVVVRDVDGTSTVLFDQGEALTGIWGTDASNMYIVGFMEDVFYHATHHAGTDTLEITLIPVDFPSNLTKSQWDGIDRDKFNRPVFK